MEFQELEFVCNSCNSVLRIKFNQKVQFPLNQLATEYLVFKCSNCKISQLILLNNPKEWNCKIIK